MTVTVPASPPDMNTARGISPARHSAISMSGSNRTSGYPNFQDEDFIDTKNHVVYIRTTIRQYELHQCLQKENRHGVNHPTLRREQVAGRAAQLGGIQTGGAVLIYGSGLIDAGEHIALEAAVCYDGHKLFRAQLIQQHRSSACRSYNPPGRRTAASGPGQPHRIGRQTLRPSR